MNLQFELYTILLVAGTLLYVVLNLIVNPAPRREHKKIPAKRKLAPTIVVNMDGNKMLNKLSPAREPLDKAIDAAREALSRLKEKQKQDEAR